MLEMILQSITVLDIVGKLFRKHVYQLMTPVLVRPNKRFIRFYNLQTVDCACPGGSKGKTDESTIRSACIPKTFPFESTTAFGSVALPIAPNADLVLKTTNYVVQAYMLHLHDEMVPPYAGYTPVSVHPSVLEVLERILRQR